MTQTSLSCFALSYSRSAPLADAAAATARSRVRLRSIAIVESHGLKADRLKPGDKVRWADYGIGEVQFVSPLWLWIRWNRVGLLNHQPSFARWLERV